MTVRGFWLIAVSVGLLASAQAHDPGLSTADLRLEEKRLVAHLTFARGDVETLITIDTDRNGLVTLAEFGAAREQLEALALSALEVRFDNRSSVAQEVTVQLNESDAVNCRLNFPIEAGSSHLSVSSAIIARLTRGHRQFLTLRCERGGKLLGEIMLDAVGHTFQTNLTLDAASTTKPGSFWQFLLLGIEHIITGYDHIVFLIGILLVGSTFKEAAKIVTSFTLAHSLTLALATFDLLYIRASVVEPLIAISIVYIGLENICSCNLKRRWLLTFAFGLVHGFGFATVLREMGIGSANGGAVVPLLSFNLGVEIGQIGITALALPLIWRLRSYSSFKNWYVPACSVLIILIGSYWFIERMLLK